VVRTDDVSQGEGFLEPSSRGALWRRPFVATVGYELGVEDAGDALVTAAHLWPAWRSLTAWEGVIDKELGSNLDTLLPVLWGMRRSGSVEGTSEMPPSGGIDQDALPAPGIESDDIAHELVSDLVRTSFALGAAWAASRGDRGTHDNVQTG